MVVSALEKVRLMFIRHLMKGVDSIYQQSFIGAYSNVTFTQLYTKKTATTAAPALNEKVIP